MIIVALVLLGLCLGSFVNALVWRLHEREVMSNELRVKSKRPPHSPLTTRSLSIWRGRSMCPDCHHELAAKDLVPVMSWLWLKGKCRYCQRPISWQYPLVELATAGLFIVSYAFWPSQLSALSSQLLFAFWLVFLTGFMALTVYDLRWMLLPDKVVYPLLGLAAIMVVIKLGFLHGGVSALTEAVYGLLIGGGLFYLLFQLSGGKWIGGGDVKLGSLLGLIVGGPASALLLLFLASLAGTMVALPLLLTGHAKRTSRLPFGPFLILAAVVVYLFGGSLIHWYKTRLLLT